MSVKNLLKLANQFEIKLAQLKSFDQVNQLLVKARGSVVAAYQLAENGKALHDLPFEKFVRGNGNFYQALNITPPSPVSIQTAIVAIDAMKNANKLFGIVPAPTSGYLGVKDPQVWEKVVSLLEVASNDLSQAKQLLVNSYK